MIKTALIIAGTLSLCIGCAGIFIPGVPTTPFLLLTAGLYARSSDRLYLRLLNHPYLGPVIRDYKEKKGVSVTHKAISLLFMWSMITISSLFLINILWVKAAVILAGLTGTLVLVCIIPTYRSPQ